MFTHLHCHSHFSLLDGLSHVDKLCAHIKAFGMEAVALTEHGNLFSAIQLLKESKANHIKPILGCEIYTAPRGRLDREQRAENHLTLLAKSSIGFHNLIKLSSDAFINGYYYKPRTDHEIISRHSEGLICLSGCVASEFSGHLLGDSQQDKNAAYDLAILYSKMFKDNFYIEIQNNGLKIQRDHAERAIDLANRLGLPIVATSDCHYIKQSDYKAHDILLCVNTKSNIYNENRFRFEGSQFHVRSEAEMIQAFSGLPKGDEYLKQSGLIAEQVEENYEGLDIRKRKFPGFDVPKDKKGKQPSADQYLGRLCRAGMFKRLDEGGLDKSREKEYAERLEYELNVIYDLGFSTYFLIISDIVDFMGKEGIPNSARGSACGSLVSYSLYISHIDPIVHGLLFERFLDPSRKDFPDIDIDCCKDRRQEVLDYINNKYGYENVASICTIGTMAARVSLKDVARALLVPLMKVEQLTSLISKKPDTTIDSTLTSDSEFVNTMRSDRDLTKVVAYGRQLEGTARSVGVHAAGIVISPVPLVELLPLQTVRHKVKGKKEKTQVITQWDMEDIEYAGMLKMDILGLRTLTMINHCRNLVNEGIENEVN